MRTSRYTPKLDDEPFGFSPQRRDLLQILNRHRYARKPFLQALTGAHPSSLKVMLRRLTARNFLAIPRQTQNIFRKVIYELGAEGEKYLREIEAFEDSPLLINTRRNEGHRDISHQLMVDETLMSIELALRDLPTLRLVEWHEVIDADLKSPFRIPSSITFKGKTQWFTDETPLSPDGFFGIEHNGDYGRFYMLECDRATEPLTRNSEGTSIRKMLLKYKKFFDEKGYETRFELPNMFMLFLTTDVKRMQSVIKLAQELECSNRFLFKAVPSFLGEIIDPEPAPYILTDPWLRTNGEPFSLLQ